MSRTTKSMDEKSVINQCLRGDANAFEILVRKYQSQVYAISLNFLKNRDEAKDMTQETFLQAFANLDRFDLERSFKTWLFSIAVKRNLDRLKKNRSILNYFKKKSLEIKHDLTVRKRGLEESEFFSPLLKQLKPRERLALLLKMEENFSAREIAEVLDCSESTARVHVFNAKQKIKQMVDGIEENGDKPWRS